MLQHSQSEGYGDRILRTLRQDVICHGMNSARQTDGHLIIHLFKLQTASRNDRQIVPESAFYILNRIARVLTLKSDKCIVYPLPVCILRLLPVEHGFFISQFVP